jgi:quercetin dioxygenase-like cupin family protein
MTSLILENRHTGERLELQRTIRNGKPSLIIRGTLPPHRQGPLLHVHHAETEEGRVLAGTLSATVDGRDFRAGAGEVIRFPAGSVHRWWNDGADTLVAEGYVMPLVDLDQYLQAVFDVLNSGPAADRPPLFYMAHVMWRYRRTQGVLLMPKVIQVLLWPLIVGIGTMLGHYRGTDWPGSPGRCREVPSISGEQVS